MKTCCIDITIASDIGLMNRMPSSIPIDTAASAYGLKCPVTGCGRSATQGGLYDDPYGRMDGGRRAFPLPFQVRHHLRRLYFRTNTIFSCVIDFPIQRRNRIIQASDLPPFPSKQGNRAKISIISSDTKFCHRFLKFPRWAFLSP